MKASRSWSFSRSLAGAGLSCFGEACPDDWLSSFAPLVSTYCFFVSVAAHPQASFFLPLIALPQDVDFASAS